MVAGGHAEPEAAICPEPATAFVSKSDLMIYRKFRPRGSCSQAGSPPRIAEHRSQDIIVQSMARRPTEIPSSTHAPGPAEGSGQKEVSCLSTRHSWISVMIRRSSRSGAPFGPRRQARHRLQQPLTPNVCHHRRRRARLSMSAVPAVAQPGRLPMVLRPTRRLPHPASRRRAPRNRQAPPTSISRS